MNDPSTSVSPGLGGFLAFFVLAIALWLLMRNMNARMRRMSYRAQQEEEARRAGGAAGPSPRSEEDAPRDVSPDGDETRDRGTEEGHADRTEGERP
jgi:hypothetical protein